MLEGSGQRSQQQGEGSGGAHLYPQIFVLVPLLGTSGLDAVGWHLKSECLGKRPPLPVNTRSRTQMTCSPGEDAWSPLPGTLRNVAGLELLQGSICPLPTGTLTEHLLHASLGLPGVQTRTSPPSAHSTVPDT